jgi:MFS family permease
MRPAAPTARKAAPRPWHFFILVLPFGASFGFVSVALAFLARQRGISVEAVGAVVAAAFAPHAPKFLWAPIVDVTWSRKGWYLLALVLVSIGTFVCMAMPIRAGSLGALTAVVVASQFGLTLLGMACEGMIGHGIAAHEKSAASGWFQAGAFLGQGLGGGAALKLVDVLGGPIGGAVLGAGFLACALPLLWFDEPPVTERPRVRDALRGLGRDLRDIVRSPGGLAAVVICLSPVGSGAASNLFGAIADEWRASLEVVVFTTGALGGVVSALGAGAGGWLAGRMGTRLAYALGGALTAAVAVVMALAPHVPAAYAVLTLAYQVMNGAAFAAFSAFAFETAGTVAVATKYNVLASLANVAITYSTRIDGAAHARWGPSGLLLTDAALTAGGIGLLTVVVVATRGRKRAARSSESP